MNHFSPPAATAAPEPGPAPAPAAGSAEAEVTALYAAHALGLTRLAYVMTGDRSAAEDVVQEAFAGLYRRWSRLTSPAKALPYLRSSVMNGCRTYLSRDRGRRAAAPAPGETWLAEASLARSPSAEAAVLDGEDRAAVMAAIMRLPHRQREVLVLRYYLDISDAGIAALLGLAGGTVRSTMSRALRALGADLRENS